MNSVGDAPLARRHVAVEQLPSLRHLLDTVAARTGMAPDRTGRLVLGVNEAVTNAITHGGGSADVVIRHDRREHRLLVQVADDGPGMPRRVVACPDPTAAHGRGLYLLRRLCDRVEIASGDTGTVVTVSMALCGR